MTGIPALFESRRFWTLVLDAVLSLAIYFVGKYFAVALEDLRFLILTLQPIALLLIATFTVEDMQAASLATQLQMHQATIAAQTGKS
jgi:hypothetical protein